MSIHIQAKKQAIADTVLIVGDPLRAKCIAEVYLSQVSCYNKVRGAFGYTGYYHDQRVSVQSVGMGMPSASIYTHELIDSYEVKRIIRVGTAGSAHKHVQLKDIVLVMNVATDSNMMQNFFPNHQYIPCADFELLAKAKAIADQRTLPYHIGAVLATDHVYGVELSQRQAIFNAGVLAVEMEIAIVYTLAAIAGISSLSIVTISDNLITGISASAEDRQKNFTQAIELALDIV